MGETCVDDKENVDSLWWDKDFGSLTAFCQSILLSFISFPLIRCWQILGFLWKNIQNFDKTLPVFLGGSYDEKYVGDDEDGVAFYI